MGRKAPYQQAAAAEEDTRAKHQVSHFQNLCEQTGLANRWPGRPEEASPRAHVPSTTGPRGTGISPEAVWLGGGEFLSFFLLKKILF